MEFRERRELAAWQQARLGELLDEIWEKNAFYAQKFAGFSRPEIEALGNLTRLPFTTKAELLDDQEANPPYGRNLTYPLARYCRLHQTSGTRGRPLRWLDTAESWQQLLATWEAIYSWLDIGVGERVFFAFSFGPFLGFWTAFEAAARRGCLCLPAGGLSSGARLHMLLENQATVVLCTPTYALHLAEVAHDSGLHLAKAARVRALIVAGEPGGCIPTTRARIEEAWHARLFDHSGMTETGPMAIECREQPGGLHVLEDRFLVEVIDPAKEEAVPAGQVGELVVTNLQRHGSPLVRYRTGDLVRLDDRPCPCGRPFLRLEGGILGRTDDMIHLRGNNFYPAALEGVIRRFPEVAEFKIEVDQSGSLAVLRIAIEPQSPDRLASPDRQGGEANLAERISQAIRDEFLFRAEVQLVPPGTLPRFEMKAQRISIKSV